MKSIAKLFGLSFAFTLMIGAAWNNIFYLRLVSIILGVAFLFLAREVFELRNLKKRGNGR